MAALPRKTSFLECGEAALPVSPKCNARCIGCISEQEPDAGLPSPQTRIAEEAAALEMARGGDRSSRAGRGRDRLVWSRLRGRTAPALDRDRADHRTDSCQMLERHRSISTRTEACRRRSCVVSTLVCKPYESVSTRFGPEYTQRTIDRRATILTTFSDRFGRRFRAVCA